MTLVFFWIVDRIRKTGLEFATDRGLEEGVNEVHSATKDTISELDLLFITRGDRSRGHIVVRKLGCLAGTGIRLSPHTRDHDHVLALFYRF